VSARRGEAHYDFVKVDSKRTEQEWEPVENKLRQAVADIENGTGLADPACVQTIKEVIALRYARSIETLETVEKLFDTTIENKKAAMLRQREVLDRLYQAKTGDAAGLKDDDAREAFVDAFHGRFRWIFNSGTYFRFRVVYLFHAALDLIAPMKVQVLRAPPGSEFLISDAPVITADASGNRRGVRNNIACSCPSRHTSLSRSTTSPVISLSMPRTFASSTPGISRQRSTTCSCIPAHR
jgi:hypothetical protein